MTYYLLRPLLEGFAELRFSEVDDEVTSQFESGLPCTHAQHGFNAFKLAESDQEPLHDFPAMQFGIFALSERAWRTLSHLISKDVEVIRLKNLDGNFFAVNVLSVLAALDLVKSRYTCFSNGRIDEVLDHVFDPKIVSGHHIFRIPERVCDTFVSQTFVDIARSAGLRGLRVIAVAELN